MKVLIFGTGEFYQKRKRFLKNIEIEAFIDNDKDKQGRLIDGIPIIPPKMALSIEYDYICIMSIYKTEIKEQLLQIGVSIDKIIDFHQIDIIIQPGKSTIYHRKSQILKKNEENKVLLISHELSNTGAPIVLYNVAVLLKKHGYIPIILSLLDGPLRKEIVNNDITVIVNRNISIYDCYIKRLLQESDLIWINTLSFAYLINELDTLKKPICWWLHEGQLSYKHFDVNNLQKPIREDISIFAVGALAILAYKRYIGGKSIKNLLYGIPDTWDIKSMRDEEEEKIVFAIVGTISYRKAQDIYLKAIISLTRKERKKAEFWVIGGSGTYPLKEDQELEEDLKTINIPEFKLLGEKGHDDLIKIYSQIDVIVCPSRNDPMPVVLTEAMMNHKVCIASDMTGTAGLICDEKSGLICKAGNVKSLVEKIRWILLHRDRLHGIGEEARKLYDEKFAMDVFENNILQILPKVIKNKIDIKNNEN